LTFANTALPGTQFMVDVGTAVADMWTKLGVKVNIKNYEWGSFSPLQLGDQAQLVGVASMYRTVGRPDMPWRYNGLFRPTAPSAGRQGQLRRHLPRFVKTYRALLSSSTAASARRYRPHGRDRLQLVDGGADPRGHELLRGQYEKVGSSPHPGGMSLATCSNACRGPTKAVEEVSTAPMKLHRPG
jgi:hypothetical protein